jgi:foldase protein PrsA
VRRPPRVAALVVGALALALVAGACDLTPYAAVVNGHTISQASLDAELSAIRSNRAFLASLERQGPVEGSGTASFAIGFVDSVLDRDIALALVRQDLARRRVSVTPEELAIATSEEVAALGGTAVFDAFPASYRRTLVEERAEVLALEASLAGVSLGRRSLERYYEAHEAGLALACVSHILVQNAAAAASVEAQLAKGASFAALARADSIDASSAPTGGQLGCHPVSAYRSAFGAAFANAVATLPLGHPSPPVPTPYGTAILEVTARQVPSFSAALPEVLGALLGSTGQRLVATVARLAAHARVEVNPEYGRFAVEHGQATILPPASPPAKALELATGYPSPVPGPAPGGPAAGGQGGSGP